MRVRQFAGYHGEIADNPPLQVFLFRALIAAPHILFPEPFQARYQGAYKWAKMAAFLSAPGPQIEDPGNTQRTFRNFRETAGAFLARETLVRSFDDARAKYNVLRTRLE